MSGSRSGRGQAAAALAASLVIVSGCVRVATIEPPPPVSDLSTMTVSEASVFRLGDEVPSTVRVVVQNQNLVGVKIYAVSGDMVIPLGIVPRFGQEVMRIPDFCHARTGVIRLMADPVGYRRPVLARPVRVGPGSEINWILKSSMTQLDPNWRSTDA